MRLAQGRPSWRCRSSGCCGTAAGAAVAARGSSTLADRNILIDQRCRDYFALYQAIADSGEDEDGIFREFAQDFFELVIVDECHCGPLFEYSLAQGTDEGFLAPYRGRRVVLSAGAHGCSHGGFQCGIREKAA